MDYQQPSFYRFSEDSLWLVKTVAAKLSFSPRHLLDAGCGCGVIGLELSNRLESLKSLSLLEKQTEFGPYIQKNLSIGRDDLQVDIINQDLFEWNDDRKFDLVVSNPPYFKEGDGRKSPDKNTQACRTFSGPGLEDYAEKLRTKVAIDGAGFMLARTDNSDFDAIKNYEVVSKRGEVVIISFQ